MKKIIVAGLLATSMVFAGAGAASAGNLKDCMADKAGAQLSEGQAALFAAYSDTKFNALSVIREQGLDLADIIKVNGFMWSAGTTCALGR